MMAVLLRVLGIFSLATVFLHTAEIKMVYAEPCSVCKLEKDDLKLCGGCRIQRYCSLECQKRDWSAHKKACKRAQHLAKLDAKIASWPVRPPKVSAKGISSGLSHTCILDTEGKVHCWGSVFPVSQVHVPKDLGTITQVSSGHSHICVLDEKGHVRCWGPNLYGPINVPEGLVGVTQVASGGDHTCVMTAENTVHCWGKNEKGQTQVPKFEKQIQQINSGANHTCALDIEGSIYAGEDFIPLLISKKRVDFFLL